MKLTRAHLLIILNLVAMSTLFVGYILTTGLQVLDPEKTKNFFRFVSAGSALLALIIGRRLTIPFFAMVYLFAMTLLASGNTININLIFLVFAFQALTALTARQASVVLFGASAAGVSIHLLARLLGIASSSATDIGGRARSAAGFANANQTALIYLSLICASLLMHVRFRSKRTLWALIISILVSISTMVSSDSRTSLVSLIIMFALYPVLFLLRKVPYSTPFIRAAVGIVPLFSVGITFYLAYSRSVDLDLLLSYRPYLFGIFLLNIKRAEWLWGWQVFDYQTIDNSYLTLLSSVGIVVMAAILLVFSRMIARTNFREMPIAIMIFAAGITESFMVRPEILLSSVLLAVLFRSQFKPELESYNIAADDRQEGKALHPAGPGTHEHAATAAAGRCDA